ncbi:G5 domain-containing protein [Irregularibacter muris]|uniref:G5 domain-containing protein n=1 Tax=Irregularibacter muris TaxID=1796619 RepID=A0AAE3KZN8_9FIRM|nr:G5 domain-containing protein [Irregularibacter muris]MCR1899520.1 G5 domain-containing protein [Irregularibacter muris]
MENHRQKVRELIGNYKHPILLMLLTVGIITAVGFYHLTQKDITIIDVKEEIKLTTRSKTVEQVLKEKNISLQDKDIVEPALDTPLEDGIEIQIKRAVPLHILVDGKNYQVTTALTQVGEIIEEAGIRINPLDRVAPDKEAEIEEEREIHIVRVTEKIITEEENIDFTTQKKPDNHLEKGKTKVVQKGQKGLKKNQIKITYEDGEESQRETLKEEVVIEPKDEVIQVGMLSTINTSRGATRFEKTMTVTATAYSQGDAGVGNTTSVGAPLKRGVIAVDPRVIPYYTRLYVPGYGFGQALDTGGAIKGNRIDLAMGSRAEALRYGRRKVKIYLLGR